MLQFDLRPTEFCGACQDCQGKPREVDPAHAVSEDSAGRSLHLFCLEPSERNFKALQHLHQSVFADLNQATSYTLQWSLHQLAVSNSSGILRFPADCGSETCSLPYDDKQVCIRKDYASTPSRPLRADHNCVVANLTRSENGLNLQETLGLDLVNVQANTVDDFFEKELLPAGIFHVELLKIDTEGFDPLVLQGAHRTLAEGRATMLQFEYHNLRAWSHTSLKSVVQDLETLGYTCYFDGSPTLLRITNLWVDSLEFRDWSNIICALTSLEPLVHALNIRSFGLGPDN